MIRLPPMRISACAPDASPVSDFASRVLPEPRIPASPRISPGRSANWLLPVIDTVAQVVANHETHQLPNR
jgi:hypothetical protein